MNPIKRLWERIMRWFREIIEWVRRLLGKKRERAGGAKPKKIFDSYKFCVSFPHDDASKEPPTSTEIDAQFKRLKRIKELYLPSLGG